jgi:HrpA-like RNA helicase
MMRSYPEPPDDKELQRTVDSLTALGAIQLSEGRLKITQVGQEMIDIEDIDDLHTARLLIEGKRTGNLEVAAAITAVGNSINRIFINESTRDERNKILTQFKKDGSDHVMYANLWQEISAHLGDQEWIKAHKIDLSKWQGVIKEKNKLAGNSSGGHWDTETIGKLVLVGYADRLMHKNPDGVTYSFNLTPHPTHIQIDKNSAAYGHNAEWVIIGDINKFNDTLSAQKVSVIPKEWIEALFPGFLPKEEKVSKKEEPPQKTENESKPEQKAEQASHAPTSKKQHTTTDEDHSPHHDEGHHEKDIPKTFIQKVKDLARRFKQSIKAIWEKIKNLFRNKSNSQHDH